MRWLLTGLVCGLTIYAPVELTQYIIDYGLDVELGVELAIMWFLYIGGLVIVYRFIKEDN